MASYGLKYKAEWLNVKKQNYRLQIYQRSYTGGSTTIGYLAGCVLEVQGNMGDIIAPIIKTQLRFTVVDAPDEPTVGTGKKFGNWQEFFTPDATLYKVVLGKSTDGGSSYTDVWSGYITPDSWQESLEYRGYITITARDNIGHLKDFPFSADGWSAVDANGLVELRWVLSRAMEVIDFPMTFAMESWGTGQYSADVPCDENDNYLTEACVNVALFEGMNWYDILEQTLEAMGFVFRFVGDNRCVAMSLRNLPKLGNYTAATGSQALEFYGGTMELDPAVKKIVEEQDYKQQNEVELEFMDGLTFNSDTTYRCATTGNKLPGGGIVSIPEHDAKMNTVAGGGRTGWDAGSGMLNPASLQPDSFLRRAEGEDGWRNYAFIAGNQVLNSQGTSPNATFRFKTKTSAIKLKFRFTEHALTIEDWGTERGRVSDKSYSLNKILYYVMYSDGTTTRYWNGYQWTANAELLTAEYDSSDFNVYNTELEIVLGKCDDITNGGEIAVRFGQIVYKCWSSGGEGCYARVCYAGAELTATTALQGNKVTTINSDDFNVMLTRKPLFGALSQDVGFVTPKNYLAGLFFYPYYGSDPQLFSYMVRFTDQGGSNLVPLPVLIHEQILCYYYGAAMVLNGSCAPTDNAFFEFNKLATYKGNYYLFQGGTLDLFSGIISNAVFRNYVDYLDLFSGATTPTWSGSVSYDNGGSSGGSGGGSSSPSSGTSGTGGGGSVKSVAMTVPTGLQVSGSPITQQGTLAVSLQTGHKIPMISELLPMPAQADNGKTLIAVDGMWEKGSPLPSVSASDNGKVLKVVSGAWAKGTDAGYVKPSDGIPSSDMTPAVQTSLGKAESALQAVPSDYKKVVFCASEAAYNAISPKDPDTLYLIAETT